MREEKNEIVNMLIPGIISSSLTMRSSKKIS
nr:MAG TPA: hypothetical protein [Caudoviricetes sp.]